MFSRMRGYVFKNERLFQMGGWTLFYSRAQAPLQGNCKPAGGCGGSPWVWSLKGWPLMHLFCITAANSRYALAHTCISSKQSTLASSLCASSALPSSPAAASATHWLLAAATVSGAMRPILERLQAAGAGHTCRN